MREFCVAIRNVESARQLVCDYCNTRLSDFFYAKIYDDGRDLYIEDYVCPECRKRVLKDFSEIELDKCEPELLEAIRENLSRTSYGYMAFASSLEELELLLTNPFLIKFWGEEF